MAAVFYNLEKLILKPFNEMANLTSSALINIVVPIIIIGLIINILWQGLSILRGNGGKHVLLDLFANNFRTMLVLMLALGSAGQYQNIVDVLSEAKYVLVSTGLRPDNGTSYTSTGDVFDNLFVKLVDLNAKASELTISKLLLAVPIAIITVASEIVIMAFICITFAETIIAQGAIYIVVATGPIFIAAAAFQKTESYFTGWLNSMLRYAFEIAVLLMLVGLSQSILEMFMNGFIETVGLATLGALFSGGAQLIIGTVLLIYLTTKVHSIVGNLIGGGSSGSSSILQGAAAAAIGFALLSKNKDKDKGDGGGGGGDDKNAGGAGTGSITGGPPSPASGLGDSSKGITDFPSENAQPNSKGSATESANTSETQGAGAQDSFSFPAAFVDSNVSADSAPGKTAAGSTSSPAPSPVAAAAAATSDAIDSSTVPAVWRKAKGITDFPHAASVSADT